MPQNVELFNALNSQNIPDSGAYQAALDAILIKDRQDNGAFRDAILDPVHRNTWIALGVVIPAAQVNDDGFLAPNGDVGAGAVEAQNIVNLHKLAAEKKVFSNLYKHAPLRDRIIAAANDQALRDEIITPDGQDVFGDFTPPGGRLPAWNSADDTNITAAAVKRIRDEAIRQLILERINACQDYNQIEALLNAGTSGIYQHAIRNLGAPPLPVLGDILGKVLLGAHLAPIRREAAKKGVELYVKQITPAQAAALPLNTLTDVLAFRNAFPGVRAVADLHDNDVVYAQAMLGPLVLKAKLASAGLTQAKLEEIAIATTVAELRAALNGTPLDGIYVAHIAPTPDELKELRKIAAEESLKMRIGNPDPSDLGMLVKLAEAQNADNMGKILQNYQASFKPNLIAALPTPLPDPLFQAIKTSAFVQKSVLKANPGQMAFWLDAGNTINNFNRSVRIDPSDAAAVNNYLLDPANKKRVRERALIACAKTNLTELNDAALNALVTANDAASAQAGGQAILDVVRTRATNANLTRAANNKLPVLGGIQYADDLLGDPNNGGLSKELQAYAAAEQTVRNNKKADFAALQGLVNDPATAPGPHGGLIATLPVEEKQKLQVRLLEALIANCPLAQADNLSALAQAKDRSAFNSALITLGVNPPQPEFYNDRIQALATENTLRLKIQMTVPPFGARPELVSVLKNLPLKEQEYLINKPEILNTLARARTREEIQRALGGREIKGSALLNLLEENRQFALIDRINNAAIAKRIAQIPPSPDHPRLTEDELVIINEQIQTQGVAAFDAAQAAANNDFMGNIGNLRGRLACGPDPHFNPAFGLNLAGNNIDALEIQAAIAQAHAYNEELIDYYHNTASSHNAWHALRDAQAKISRFSGIDVLLDDNVARAQGFVNADHAAQNHPLQYADADTAIAAIDAAINPTPSNSDKAILEFFLSLEKLRKPNANEVHALLTDFKAAKTAQEFLDKTNDPQKPYAGVFDAASLKQRLTPQVFNEVQRKARKDKFLDRAHYSEHLQAQVDALKPEGDFFNTLQKADTAWFKQNGMDAKLDAFSKTTALGWLNPAFQAHAQQNALANQTKFRELARATDIIVPQLHRQKALLETERDALPSKEAIEAAAESSKIAAIGQRPVHAGHLAPPPLFHDQVKAYDARLKAYNAKTQEQINAIEKRRKVLESDINSTNKKLATYERAQKILHGSPSAETPLLRKGILQLLDESIEGKKSIKFLDFYSSYKDYDMGDKDAHMQANSGFVDKSVVAHLVSMKAQGAASYETVERVSPAQFREHTIGSATSNGNTIRGTFIEERGPDRIDITSDGTRECRSDVELIVCQWPKGDDNDADVIKARVTYAMAMASQLLASANNIGPENKIVLQGGNPEQLRYLHCALVTVAEKTKLFDPQTDIKIVSAVFEPKRGRYGIGKGFSDPYLKHFKTHSALSAGIEEVAQAMVSNSDETQTPQQQVNAAKHTTQVYKGELLSGKLKSAEAQQQQEEAARPVLPRHIQ